MGTVRELLSSWNTPEDVIKHFGDEEYTINSLLTFDITTISLYIAKEGSRGEFIYNFNLLKKKHNITDVEQALTEPVSKKLKLNSDDNHSIGIDTSIADMSMNTSNHLSAARVIGNFENSDISSDALISQNALTTVQSLTNMYPVNMDNVYDLDLILNASSKGQCALSFYQNKGDLDGANRTKIAFCIIEHELLNKTEKSITADRFQFLANCVVIRFPNEVVVTWFDSSGHSSKGKLHVQYNSIRRSMKKSGVIPSNLQRTEKNKPTLLEEKEDVSALLLWLTNNSSPQSKVIEYWEKSHASRMNVLLASKTPIYEYYEKYCALKSSFGCALLEIDYDFLYPKTSLNLYSAWTNLCYFILELLQKSEKTSATLKKEITTFSELTEEEKTIFIFSNIHLLLPVNTVVNKVFKGKQSSWRPSREETRESFLLHSYDDIKAQIALRKAKLRKWDLTLQPVAVIVGPSMDKINQHFVVVDEHFYCVESTLKAIDVTFKCFQSLQANYPLESEQAWLFLQLAVYGFKTKYDKSLSESKGMASKFKKLFPLNSQDNLNGNEE